MPGPCFPDDVARDAVDKALTTDRVAAIWRYAKANYIDKGATFENTLTGVSNDIGLPRDWVARAFQKPKALREVTNEAYQLQEARRQTIRAAKDHVATIDAPGAIKLLTTLTSLPRRVLTYGHGPVFPVTHAVDLMGSEPAAYFTSMGNAWRFASKAQHATAMDWLRNHDLYVTARKSGLVIDPEQGPQGVLIGGVGKTSWARRSWDALKVTRMSLFEKRWNDVPEAERTPEMGKMLASQINHSTGVMSPGEWGFGVLSKGMFAPQLTASKIAKTFADPAKTALTYAKVAAGKDVPFAERHIASLRTQQAAKWAASYVGLLAINQGFLKASGSDERVNFTDSTKSDFLRPKGFGHTINLRGTSELIRLVGNIVAISQSSRKELQGKGRTEAARNAIAQYAQYKLEPAIQLGAEAVMGEDAFGRPLPWSTQEGTASKPKYGTEEYLLSKGPIYLGGGAREVYDTFRKEGISASDTTAIMKALGQGAVVAGIEAIGGGVGRTQEPKPKKTKKSGFSIRRQ